MSISAINGANSAWYTQAQTQAQPDISDPAQAFSSLVSQDGASSGQLQNVANGNGNGTAPVGHHGGHHHHGMGMAAQLLDSSADSDSSTDSSTSQDGAPQLAPGQALTSLLAAGAYAGAAATDSTAATSATSQLDQYI
ncbi:MAG TPA: hypothetical protein VMF57_07175 [Solirubrobacteraceae bacterium]|nr:hypothetical protein [Solirubrobacteraceae bacterium]